MAKIYHDNSDSDYPVTICNEGGSRSSKTFDFFHFLTLFYSHNHNAGLECYIFRDTLVDCRKLTYKDFKKSLVAMNIWDESKSKQYPTPYYELFGNHIYFGGLDSSTEATESDIIFVNEALEIDLKEKLEGWFMRCKKLIVMDWNPKYTSHWCFDLEGRPNVHFTHTTYKNNKHLDRKTKVKIESYCPWHFDDLHLKEGKRRPHPINVGSGTADKYQWQVYGEGIRSAPEGLIFQYVNYIDSWPIDIAPIYGLDFGFTADPTALVKVGQNNTDIYLELLLYQSTETPEEIDQYCEAKRISKILPCIADSSDRYVSEKKGVIQMVQGLNDLGWFVEKVSKTKSVMYWLMEMKKKRINIVLNELSHHARKEQENYRMKTINGIQINQPEDKFNHFFDGSRYGFMALNTGNSGMW
jgi:PBSX family phage terminase large subunit